MRRGKLEGAIATGMELIAAKKNVERGEWVPWLREHFDGSPASSKAYMRVARNAERVAHLDTIGAALLELKLKPPRPRVK